MYFALFYNFVENILEKRQPYREEHLKLLQGTHAEGLLLQAGAFDPPEQSLLIFKADSADVVESFLVICSCDLW